MLPSRWDHADRCSNFLPNSRGTHFFSPRCLRASFAAPLRQAVILHYYSSTVGILFGVVFGFIASFTTRFTRPVRYLEPLLVLTFAWLAYLTAEIWHCSGIISILFCAIYMRPYVESNICRKSHTTIKYFLKLLASSCEAVIIFVFLI